MANLRRLVQEALQPKLPKPGKHNIPADKQKKKKINENEWWDDLGIDDDEDFGYHGITGDVLDKEDSRDPEYFDDLDDPEFMDDEELEKMGFYGPPGLDNDGLEDEDGIDGPWEKRMADLSGLTREARDPNDWRYGQGGIPDWTSKGGGRGEKASDGGAYDWSEIHGYTGGKPYEDMGNRISPDISWGDHPVDDLRSVYLDDTEQSRDKDLPWAATDPYDMSNLDGLGDNDDVLDGDVDSYDDEEKYF